MVAVLYLCKSSFNILSNYWHKCKPLLHLPASDKQSILNKHFMVGQINSNYIRTRWTKFFSRMLSYALFEGRPVTTAGQWINPIVFANMSFAKLVLIKKKVEQPTFILGTGRSGTTILGIVMSMHRDVAFLNEPKALWHSVFKNEDLIGSYTRENALYELHESDAQPEAIKKMHNIFGFYLSTVFSKRVWDKYPELVFRMDFVKKIFPDFKAIFLYRNGWDTAISSAGWSDIHGEQKGEETHNWWGVNNRKWNLLCDQIVSKDIDLAPHLQEIKKFTSELDKSIVEWIVSMRFGIDACKKYPNHVLPVRYEDLAAHPQKTINEICTFCNLSDDAKLMEYAIETLKPVPSKKPVEINPLLKDAFMKIMKEMKYD